MCRDRGDVRASRRDSLSATVRIDWEFSFYSPFRLEYGGGVKRVDVVHG